MDKSYYVPVKKKRMIEKSQEDAVPLPDPFTLPKHFSTEVEVAIKMKKLSNFNKRVIIGKSGIRNAECTCTHICYKRYPTSNV